VADRAPAVRLPRPVRREQLLDVAAALIAECGLDAVTMEGVAARAGVSKGLGYAYFANRDELVVALFDREIAILDRRVASAVEEATTFEDRLRAVVHASFDVVRERGVVLGALTQSALPPGPLLQRRRARQRGVEAFFAALVTDEFGLVGKPAEAAVAILLAGYGGALQLWIDGRMSRRDIAEVHVRLAVGGLRGLTASVGATNGDRASDGPADGARVHAARARAE
jgi:AcrR family transcriptional regulator